MSDQLPARPAQPGEAPRALRVLALIAVCVGIAALAGAAFVLSYAGIHAVALQAGVSTRLARGYPLIFDVLLLVILAALLALRGAGLPTRLYAWICLLALLATAAGADALHAAGRRLAAQPAAVTAAVLPWALVLIAFGLLLAMLRQARLRRAAAAAAALDAAPGHWQVPPPPSTQPLVPGFGARPADPAQHGKPAALGQPVVRAAAASSQAQAPSPAVEAPTVPQPAALGPGDTLQLTVPPQGSRESADDDATVVPGQEPATAAEAADSDPAAETSLDPTEPDHDDTIPAFGAPVQAATDEGTTAEPDMADPEMPVFHRVWSSPTPPASEDPE